jgi:hypothetical protein
LPGGDQFKETDGPVILGAISACDKAFDEPAFAGCSAARRQRAAETLTLIGPSRSTDQSAVFTTELTWTAS